MTSLVVSPAGTVPAPALDWSLCLAPKPSTENNVVNASCLASGGSQALASATPTASVTIPYDACRLFGPQVPPQPAGQPPFAPRAPDATGGYYQPVRVDFQGDASIALERIECSPPGASLDLAAQFEQLYTPNRNPSLAELTAAVEGQPVQLGAVPAGASVTFTAGWTPDSPESFPVVDAFNQLLVFHREALTVSWYATAGVFRDERTGRAEEDLSLQTSNSWTAPPTPGEVHAWIVLRDSRGGGDFREFAITVVRP
jgi:hypothetical protein